MRVAAGSRQRAPLFLSYPTKGLAWGAQSTEEVRE